jgi:hypothetical protein
MHFINAIIHFGLSTLFSCSEMTQINRQKWHIGNKKKLEIRPNLLQNCIRGLFIRY